MSASTKITLRDTNSPNPNSHAIFAEAMRDLIKLGLPILEVGQEQAQRTAQAGNQLLAVYRKAAESSSTNIPVLVQCSMEIRQILYSIPSFYLSSLRSCLAKTVEQCSDTKLAQENASFVMDVGRRIAELQQDLWQSNYAATLRIGGMGAQATKQIAKAMLNQAQKPISPGEVPPLSPPGIPGLPPSPEVPPSPVYDPTEPNLPGQPGIPPEGDPPTEVPLRLVVAGSAV